IDGGATALGTFNTTSGGDIGDWGSGMGNDAANAFSSAGVVNSFGTVDTTAMDVLGWNVAPPSVSIALADDTGSSATDNITGNDTLTGLTTQGATVNVYEGTTLLGSAVAASNGIWTFTPATLPQGTQTVTASTTISGSTVQASLTFTYDTVAPTVTIALAPGGTTTSTGASTTDALTGTADPSAQVVISDGAGVLGTTVSNASGVWNFTPAGLAAGTYTMTATDTDTAGNTGSASLSFTYSPVVAAPTGVAVSAETSALSSLAGRSGLNAGKALAFVTETGGTSGDSFSYALGGTGAGAFTLASATGGAVLNTGANGVAGASNGRAYLLTVTANDTTSGTASPAAPLGVVVGSGANDAINVATLLGGTATPGFVYGMGGNDTINGSGMTGPLWIDGGAGADTMTGGSGPNDYLYGATTDSTAKAMDVITNFNTGQDVLDFTGLGRKLAYAGQLSGTSLQRGAIGWQDSGGNTFVYVNTSNKTESLGSTNMKIELAGSLNLSAGNIRHL
ncbi:MAG: Ig-like domain-containing protein, partial [Rhodospirillales bacterium]|nr:Ig-like domain-containing protein [Rhodospirillales bacterium]